MSILLAGVGNASEFIQAGLILILAPNELELLDSTSMLVDRRSSELNLVEAIVAKADLGGILEEHLLALSGGSADDSDHVSSS